MKKVISTDWDNSIVLWDKNNRTLNDDLLKELLEFHKNGYEIHIVTFRGPSCHFFGQDDGNADMVEDLEKIKEKYGEIFSQIHYTNGKSKAPFVDKISALYHYDDSSQVCCDLAMFSKTKPIFLDYNNPSEYNSTLELYCAQNLIEKKKILS